MNLNYFVNKICTILTVSVNLDNLSKMQVANIFTGIVEDVSDYGVLMRAMNGKKSLFFRDHIVGILEEEVVQKQEIPKPVPQPLSIDSLNDMLLKR